MTAISKGAGRHSRRARFAAAMLLAGAMGLSGCIRVEAPDKPIVIELNINIKQEVIYRLAEDAGNTIEENSRLTMALTVSAESVSPPSIGTITISSRPIAA